MRGEEKIAVMMIKSVLKHLVSVQGKMLSIEDRIKVCEAITCELIDGIRITRCQVSDEERKHVDIFARIDRDDLVVF